MLLSQELSYAGLLPEDLLQAVNPYAPDYGRRIGDAVQVLSEREGRPGWEILNDLLQMEADILRFRVLSSEAARGTLPLEEAIGLLEGAKQALLAAACTLIAPGRRHHPRLSRSEAEEMLRSCRMGQTERGSFTVAIACPVRAVEAGEVSDSEDPFVLHRGRRVHRLADVTGLRRIEESLRPFGTPGV